jgi:hypothetical protein
MSVKPGLWGWGIQETSWFYNHSSRTAENDTIKWQTGYGQMTTEIGVKSTLLPNSKGKIIRI